MVNKVDDGFDLEFTIAQLTVAYRRFVAMGYTSAQAGNLVANLVGLHTTERPWTVKQISNLLFVRAVSK